MSLVQFYYFELYLGPGSNKSAFSIVHSTLDWTRFPSLTFCFYLFTFLYCCFSPFFLSWNNSILAVLYHVTSLFIATVCIVLFFSLFADVILILLSIYSMYNGLIPLRWLAQVEWFSVRCPLLFSSCHHFVYFFFSPDNDLDLAIWTRAMHNGETSSGQSDSLVKTVSSTVNSTDNLLA